MSEGLLKEDIDYEVRLDTLTKRFLSWNLPVSFSPNNGVVKMKSHQYGDIKGENLLTYGQARNMLLEIAKDTDIFGYAVPEIEETLARARKTLAKYQNPYNVALVKEINQGKHDNTDEMKLILHTLKVAASSS